MRHIENELPKLCGDFKPYERNAPFQDKETLRQHSSVTCGTNLMAKTLTRSVSMHGDADVSDSVGDHKGEAAISGRFISETSFDWKIMDETASKDHEIHRVEAATHDGLEEPRFFNESETKSRDLDLRQNRNIEKNSSWFSIFDPNNEKTRDTNECFDSFASKRPTMPHHIFLPRGVQGDKNPLSKEYQERYSVLGCTQKRPKRTTVCPHRFGNGHWVPRKGQKSTPSASFETSMPRDGYRTPSSRKKTDQEQHEVLVDGNLESSLDREEYLGHSKSISRRCLESSSTRMWRDISYSSGYFASRYVEKSCSSEQRRRSSASDSDSSAACCVDPLPLAETKGNCVLEHEDLDAVILSFCRSSGCKETDDDSITLESEIVPNTDKRPQIGRKRVRIPPSSISVSPDFTKESVFSGDDAHYSPSRELLIAGGRGPNKKVRPSSEKRGNITSWGRTEAAAKAAEIAGADMTSFKSAMDSFRGVTFRPSGKWQAQCYYKGRSRYIGVYESQQKASLAYEVAMKKLLEGGEDKLEREEAKEALAKRVAEARSCAQKAVKAMSEQKSTSNMETAE